MFAGSRTGIDYSYSRRKLTGNYFLRGFVDVPILIVFFFSLKPRRLVFVWVIMYHTSLTLVSVEKDNVSKSIIPI